MKLRDRWRRFRLYYKSWPLFKRLLVSPVTALFLPWRSCGHFKARNGIRFEVPGKCWYVLPNFVRLASIGAEPSIVGNNKRVKISGITLDSPLDTKEEGNFCREIFVEDVYRIRHADLTGKVVVDIGAYIGDSAIAFSQRGAEVFALEPSQKLYKYLVANTVANGLGDRIHTFAVGLSNRPERVVLNGNGAEEDCLVLVEGIDFVLQNLPKNVEYLKIDCEGCEYYLLGNQSFLGHLRPNQIALEYHYGLQDLKETLENAGYLVDIVEDTGQVGYLYAEQQGLAKPQVTMRKQD